MSLSADDRWRRKIRVDYDEFIFQIESFIAFSLRTKRTLARAQKDFLAAIRYLQTHNTKTNNDEGGNVEFRGTKNRVIHFEKEDVATKKKKFELM